MRAYQGIVIVPHRLRRAQSAMATLRSSLLLAAVTAYVAGGDLSMIHPSVTGI
jgi:hypothetical protein